MQTSSPLRGRGTLPAEPLRRWLRGHLAVLQTEGLSEEVAGIYPRIGYRLLHESKAVSLDVADRLLVAYGQSPALLHELYPLPDEPVTDRWCSACHDIVIADSKLTCPWCSSETRPVTHSTGERWGVAA